MGDGARSRHQRRQEQGDPIAQAAEFVVGPLLFGFVGWLLDQRLDTGRTFMVVLAVMGFVAVALTNYYRYMTKVTRDDEGKPWTRRQR